MRQGRTDVVEIDTHSFEWVKEIRGGALTYACRGKHKVEHLDIKIYPLIISTFSFKPTLL
ncbi:MAG: hypothetical protein ACP5RI_03665 [Candidatus Micrarchaeia archaeon]